MTRLALVLLVAGCTDAALDDAPAGDGKADDTLGTLANGVPRTGTSKRLAVPTST